MPVPLLPAPLGQILFRRVLGRREICPRYPQTPILQRDVFPYVRQDTFRLLRLRRILQHTVSKNGSSAGGSRKVGFGDALLLLGRPSS